MLHTVSRTRGSVEDDEATLSDRVMLMAQMKMLSGRRVMLALLRVMLGSGRQERALAGPICTPGVCMKTRSKSCRKSIQHTCY